MYKRIKNMFRKCVICLKDKDNTEIIANEYVCEDCIEAQRQE